MGISVPILTTILSQFLRFLVICGLSGCFSLLRRLQWFMLTTWSTVTWSSRMLSWTRIWIWSLVILESLKKLSSSSKLGLCWALQRQWLQKWLIQSHMEWKLTFGVWVAFGMRWSWARSLLKVITNSSCFSWLSTWSFKSAVTTLVNYQWCATKCCRKTKN